MISGLLVVFGLVLATPAQAQERQVAGVVVQMQGPANQPDLNPIVQVIDASGTVVDVPLHDDAEPPDDRAGDGLWSGIAMGLTGETFTVRLPAGPDSWMSGSFTVTDPWRPVVRFRPAPGGALVTFEPVADPSGSSATRSNPWLPTSTRSSEAPSPWWLALASGLLVIGAWGLGRRLRGHPTGSPRRSW